MSLHLNNDSGLIPRYSPQPLDYQTVPANPPTMTPQGYKAPTCLRSPEAQRYWTQSWAPRTALLATQDSRLQ